MRGATIAGPLLLPVLLSGCGFAYPAFAALGIVESQDGGAAAAPPPPPSISAASSLARPALVNGAGAPSATEIRVDYALADPSGAPASLDATWRRAGEPPGSARAASMAAGSDGTTGLASAPDPGTPHRFVWAAGRDLAAAGFVEEDAVLTLRPRRADATGAAHDISIRAGNRPPAIALDPVPGPQSRDVPATFTVADSSSDLCSVTLAATDPASGLSAVERNVLVPAGSATLVNATPSGTGGGIVWDSTVGFGYRNLTLIVTVTARDLFGLSASASTTVAIVNDNPPVAQILSIGFPNLATDHRVPVTVRVTDPEALLDPAGSGQASLLFEYSLDQTAFLPASGLLLGEGARDFADPPERRPTGNGGDPAAGVTRFLWDTLADVGTAPRIGQPVALRVTPVNALRGVSTTAANLFMYNDAARFTNPSDGFISMPHPLAIVAADLDGDGIVDAAITDEGGFVNVYRGRGDGRFDLAASVTVGAEPFAIVAGDLDGDGVPDLAVGNAGSQSVSVLRGRGDGTFQALQTVALGHGPLDVAMADFTGDGVPDLAVALADGDVEVLAGRGDGRFDVLAHVSAGTNLFAIRALDVTGDGIPDLAVADHVAQGAVEILRGRGDGQFDLLGSLAAGAFPVALEAGDWNGDGVADLAVVNRQDDTVSIFLGRPGGAFSLASTQPTGTRPEVVVAADLTGDGIPDLAVPAYADDVVSILPGRGDGGFRTTIPESGFVSPLSLAAADLNGDGDIDLVALQTTSGAVTAGARPALNDGPLRIRSIAEIPTAPGPNAVVSGDWNGDGVPDLAIAADHLSIAKGLGDGQFAVTQDITASASSVFVGIEAGDWNGDGIPDLAVADGGLNAVLILLGAGNGLFRPVTNVTVGATPADVVACDLDGDGVLDLAVANVDDATVSILHGLGDGRFASVATLSVGGSPQALAVADLTGDGIPDLAVASFDANAVRIFSGRGDGQFDVLGDVPVGVSPFAILALDLTGDGIPDLITADQGSDTLTLLRGRGDGRFDRAAASPTVYGPLSLAAGGFASDGMPGFAVGATGRTIAIRRTLPKEGDLPPARGELGGAGQRLVIGHDIPVLSGTNALATLDAAADGVPDLAILTNANTVEIKAVENTRASRPLRLAAGALPAPLSAGDGRVVNVFPLDPALGEPGLVMTPTAGMRLAPASLATTVCPDTATMTGNVVLSLPLFATLTQDELSGAAGAIHVYRHERNVQGASRLPYRRPPKPGRIVEVASTAPVRPAGIAAATIDPVAGTITFPVSRLGTFESFIEVKKGVLTLLRETFDDVRSIDGARRPLPRGWVSGFTWQVGPPPSPTALPAGPSGAASFPYVLGTNLRGAAYRKNAADNVTTTSILLGGPVLAQERVALRFREWVRLGAGDTLSVAVVRPDGTEAPVPEAGHSGPFSSAGDGFVAAGPFDLTARIGSATSFRLSFRLSSGAVDPRRGWYLDDIDVSLEPR